MRTRAFRAPLALLGLLSLGACGGEAGPAPGSLSNVIVSPAEPQLFTVAPGNTIELEVRGQDEDGYTLTGGDVRFASSAPSVATVGHDGTITGLRAGTAQIDTWLTIGEATVTATTQVRVMAGASSDSDD